MYNEGRWAYSLREILPPIAQPAQVQSQPERVVYVETPAVEHHRRKPHHNHQQYIPEQRRHDFVDDMNAMTNFVKAADELERDFVAIEQNFAQDINAVNGFNF